MTTTSQTPSTQEPYQAISLHGTLAKATIGVGIVAGAMGMISRDRDTMLGEVGGFVGALAVLVLVGPIAELYMGRAIDHVGKMGDAEWKQYSETRTGRVLSRVACGKLASFLVSVGSFMVGFYGATPLVEEGPTLANVAMAMAGAGVWVATNTVLGRLKSANTPKPDDDIVPPRPRMR